jgi:hypothetical protein
MSRFHRLVISFAVSMVTLAGCGGGGSTPQSSPTSTTPPVSSSPTTAGAYTGSWTGAYSVAGAAGTPVTISLVGVDATNAVTGNVYSASLSGAFTGSLDNAGNVVGTVANIVDGQSWSIQFGILGNVLNILKATYGAASLGTGSCTATPLMTVDMSGSWKGTITQKNLNTGLAVSGTTQNVDVELAYDGAGGFVGAIVSDNGLTARIKFVVLAGYWACYIDQASSWGTLIPAPQYGSLLTQGMITSTAVMQQSFAADPAAPSGMANIDLSDTSSPTVVNGVSYTSYAEFLMSLSRSVFNSHMGADRR